MAAVPTLEVPDLSPPPHDDPPSSSTAASPARGREMRQNLLSKLRPPPLVHSWDFWHDRQDRPARAAAGTAPSPDAASPPPPTAKYEERLVHLSAISDVRAFWSVFNNFDVAGLPLRDSVHLFHRGVKPVWEDPRNARGGCWTFRVPKDRAPDFWKEVCMLAIGEQLQAAVASDRTSFRDDVCGVSLSVRFTSVLVQVWNRDADHDEGVRRLAEAVIEGMPAELKPKEGSWYYKKHAEHKGFDSSGAA